jgi:DNA polymerase III subunit epsilon
VNSELIALIDTETTGVDPKKDAVIEASWALVQVSTAKVVEVHSRLFAHASNDAAAINGIPVELLSAAQVSRQALIDAIEEQGMGVALPKNVTAIVAHNAEFDRQWRIFGPTSLPWLDTRDWRWPRASADSKLVEIALAHGVGVTSAHRAYTDVLTMAALLERVHEVVPLAEQLEYARRPRQLFEAVVSFDDKDKAKSAGFRWEPDRKRWVRRMLPEDVAKLGFKTRAVAA